MQYVSTRGEAPVLDFEDVILTGLARDGGLYVPARWPEFSAQEIARFAGMPYTEIAFHVMWPYLGGAIEADEFRTLIEEAYSGFNHCQVTPLVQIGPGEWIMELFHGPTLAFKDIAMQIAARLMDRALKKRGERATIVVATSGDTGGSAIEAFRGRDAIDIFCLYPHGRVTEVQRRQMTTPTEDNVYTIALEGVFDDCQAFVKNLFNDLPRRDALKLTAVNSINWARIMAQMVYYFASAAALGAPSRPMRYAVPSGNFGDIYAGYVARKMGLPIERLIIATNVNNILEQTWRTGVYAPRGVVATSSPSMDIAVSSNFERLVYEITDHDTGRVKRLMEDLPKKGSYSLSEAEHARFKARFAAYRATEEDTRAMIKKLFKQTGYLADPHTAIGVKAARDYMATKRSESTNPIITLATAHPVKFPDVVIEASGQIPPSPPIIAQQKTMKERFEILPNDFETLADYIQQRSRAAKASIS